MADNSTIYVAKESFTTTLDGQSIQVVRGQTRVRAGHKLMKGREMFFEPLTVHYDTEQATKAPGEQRGTPRASRPAPEPVSDAPAATETPETPAAGADAATDESGGK